MGRKRSVHRYIPQEQRFWLQVAPMMDDRGCWEWAGAISSNGYGAILWNSKLLGPHRVSWILHYGDIPSGLIVCHTCDNRSCVNPAHLWLGTTRDNAIDMSRKGRAGNQIPQEFCKRGHPMSKRKNPKTTTGMICRVCKNAGERAAYAKKKADTGCGYRR
jgi:hypothetical protein